MTVKQYLEFMRKTMARTRKTNPNVIGAGCKDFLFPTPADFVLKYGRQYEPIKPPKHVRRGRMGECYYNSFNASMDHGLVYVEGWAMTRSVGLAMQHAWCADENGNAIDLTWADGCDYFGVAFDTKYVAGRVAKLEVAGTLIEDYFAPDSFALLRGLHPKVWKYRPRKERRVAAPAIVAACAYA